MMRLFAALELPPHVKAALAMLRGGVDSARWQSDAQYHLTLRFIGEVASRTAEDIHRALETLDFAPFDVRLRGLGMFGKVPRPRALWIGVEDPAPLVHLHEKIDAALARIGLPGEERKYKPHVTLARFNGRSRRLESHLVANQDAAAPPFRVGHMTLFRSHLAAEGARYLVEARYVASGAEPVENAFDAVGIAAAEEAYMDE